MNTTLAPTRQVLAARFSTPDGGTRAVGALSGAMADKIGNAAVLYVTPSGGAKFVEMKDFGAKRGALVGGLIGIIGGPVGILTGSALGALASKLRDSGFPDDQLKQLGTSLGPDSSAVVLDIAVDALPTARQLLESLDAQDVVTVPIDASVADLFHGHPVPEIEPDPAAFPS